MAARKVLRGARWPGDIAVEHGLISKIGSITPDPGDEVIACDGAVITAGLVNTHHHLFQWLTRGGGDGCDLLSWLRKLYPIWVRISVEDVAAAATVGLAELAMSGATTVADHHYIVPHGDDSVFDAIALAARKVGVRLHLSRGSMDVGESAGGLPPDDVVEGIDAILASTEAVTARLHDGDRVSVVIAPASTLCVSPQLMVESANLARKLGLRMHTHLAETIDMEQDCVDRFGRRSVDVLEELGWIDNDVWFAHVIHLNASEIVRLGAAGTGIAHCPSSNGRLGAGLCPVRDFLDAGAPVGLGVDGSASSEGGTLFPEIKMALYFARLLSGPSAMSPTQALELATVGGARCLGRPDLGRLEVGAPADIAVWPADDIEDIEDPIAGLVLGPTREVRHLLVGGDEVVIDGEVQGIDLRAAHTELARRARAFWD